MQFLNYAGRVRISIVIPAFNEERLLGETLRRIQSAAEVFSARRWEIEIIVCDNHSTDRTGEIARATGATVVFEPINQIARARNFGAQAARGDWLVFVDADSHPSPELFGEVAEQITSGDCLAGGCTVKLDGIYPVANYVTAHWNFASRALQWVAGSFIFCDAKAFRQIGGFNEQLFASEEIDLSKRLKKLARIEKKKVVILHRHPILTGGKVLNSRDACHPWYDGRR